VRRCLQHLDQRLAGDLPLKATVLISCNDDDLLAAVYGDELRRTSSENRALASWRSSGRSTRSDEQAGGQTCLSLLQRPSIF